MLIWIWKPFLRINPCGYAGMEMIQTKQISGPQTVTEAGEKLSLLLAESLASTISSADTGLPTT